MEERTILGIGYILSIIPVINIVGLILLIVGWIKLGNKYKENLWKWVGYSAILGIIAMILAFSTLFGALITVNMGMLVANLIASLAIAIPAIVLMLVYAILQLIGLWNAGKKFNSGLLKAGAILSIIPGLNFIGYLLAGIGFLTLKE